MSLEAIYQILVGKKVYDGAAWHVYDAADAELSDPQGVMWRANPGALLMWPRETVQPVAGGGKSKVYVPKRLIRADDIEFENIEQLTEYLAEKLEEAETKPIEVVRKKKAKQHPYAAAPVVKLQYTGPGYLEIASIYVKRANDEIRRIWAERILVMLQEQEDEETLMLLLT